MSSSADLSFLSPKVAPVNRILSPHLAGQKNKIIS